MQKYLVVGLGNVGDKYIGTRHNIGFEVAERIANLQEGKFEPVNFGLMAKLKYKGRQILVLKPDTYMNLSGKAIKFWLQKENISLENLMVVTDDLNLDFGTIRIRAKGSDGGHNGLKSIQEEINTTNYCRLRFGIGNIYSKGGQIDFVLGKWNEEEMLKIDERLDTSAKAVLSFCFAGLANTMNLYNGK